jgi:hypothetical protein
VGIEESLQGNQQKAFEKEDGRAECGKSRARPAASFE